MQIVMMSGDCDTTWRMKNTNTSAAVVSTPSSQRHYWDTGAIVRPSEQHRTCFGPLPVWEMFGHAAQIVRVRGQGVVQI